MQVVKQRVGRRLLSISRRLAYGNLARAEEVMQRTQVELGRINCDEHVTLAGTPAMAADLTDHVWSIEELIRYRCRHGDCVGSV